VEISYTPSGSGAGRRAVISQSDDFGGSDSVLTTAEYNQAPGIFQVPTVAAAIVMAYNLPNKNSGILVLSGPVLSKIYAREVRFFIPNLLSPLQLDFNRN
jgi:phosphate transport system substrate-binding protein